MPLTDSDRDLLDFEESWWTRPAQTHGDPPELGISPSTYYKRLAELVETPDALEVSPLVVRRLRRRLLERRRGRFEGPPNPRTPVDERQGKHLG